MTKKMRTKKENNYISTAKNNRQSNIWITHKNFVLLSQTDIPQKILASFFRFLALFVFV